MILSREQFLALCRENKVQGSPLDKKYFGEISSEVLGVRHTNDKGRQYFEIGDFRIAVKSSVPSKENYTISLLTAKIAIGKMAAGSSFLVAE